MPSGKKREKTLQEKRNLKTAWGLGEVTFFKIIAAFCKKISLIKVSSTN
jgi:hypothetical protein